MNSLFWGFLISENVFLLYLYMNGFFLLCNLGTIAFLLKLQVLFHYFLECEVTERAARGKWIIMSLLEMSSFIQPEYR